MHLSRAFLVLWREERYEKSVLLLSFVHFCHYVLEIPEHLSFLASIYGGEGFIKTSFLKHIEGFKVSLQIGRNLLEKKVTSLEILTYLNHYPNYTLNLITVAAKPPDEYKARKNHILEFLGHVDGGYLADIGCGLNSWASDYQERGYFVVGVDISALNLKAAAQLQPNNKGKLVASIAEALPIRSNSLDAIVASELLEHSLHPDKCLSEFFRCLKPKGRAIISVPIRTQHQHEHRKMDHKTTAQFTARMMKHPYSQLLKLEPHHFIRPDDADETHVSFFVPTPEGEEYEMARKEAIRSLVQPHGFILGAIKTTPMIIFVAQKPPHMTPRIRQRIFAKQAK